MCLATIPRLFHWLGGLINASVGSSFLYRTRTTTVFRLVAPFLLIRAYWEEQVLTAEFGEDWHAYTIRVPMTLLRWRKRTKKGASR